MDQNGNPYLDRTALGAELRAALEKKLGKLGEAEQAQVMGKDDAPENTTDHPRSLAAWKRRCEEAERCLDEIEGVLVRWRESRAALTAQGQRGGKKR